MTTSGYVIDDIPSNEQLISNNPQAELDYLLDCFSPTFRQAIPALPSFEIPKVSSKYKSKHFGDNSNSFRDQSNEIPRDLHVIGDKPPKDHSNSTQIQCETHESSQCESTPKGLGSGQTTSSMPKQPMNDSVHHLLSLPVQATARILSEQTGNEKRKQEVAFLTETRAEMQRMFQEPSLGVQNHNFKTPPNNNGFNYGGYSPQYISQRPISQSPYSLPDNNQSKERLHLTTAPHRTSPLSRSSDSDFLHSGNRRSLANPRSDQESGERKSVLFVGSTRKFAKSPEDNSSRLWEPIVLTGNKVGGYQTGKTSKENRTKRTQNEIRSPRVSRSSIHKSRNNSRNENKDASSHMKAVSQSPNAKKAYEQFTVRWPSATDMTRLKSGRMQYILRDFSSIRNVVNEVMQREREASTLHPNSPVSESPDSAGFEISRPNTRFSDENRAPARPNTCLSDNKDEYSNSDHVVVTKHKQSRPMMAPIVVPHGQLDSDSDDDVTDDNHVTQQTRNEAANQDRCEGLLKLPHISPQNGGYQGKYGRYEYQEYKRMDKDLYRDSRKEAAINRPYGSGKSHPNETHVLYRLSYMKVNS